MSSYKPQMYISCANSLWGEEQLKIKLALLPWRGMVTEAGGCALGDAGPDMAQTIPCLIPFGFLHIQTHRR